MLVTLGGSGAAIYTLGSRGRGVECVHLPALAPSGPIISCSGAGEGTRILDLSSIPF